MVSQEQRELHGWQRAQPFVLPRFSEGIIGISVSGVVRLAIALARSLLASMAGVLLGYRAGWPVSVSSAGRAWPSRAPRLR